MFIGLKKAKILWMAGEITLARRRIREALTLMQSEEDKDFFSDCYRFEKSQFRNFDPFYLFESREFLDSVRKGDRDAIAEALLFLEADPYCFRSGYMKKKLCHALKQAPLTREERFQIRNLLLRNICVQRPVSFKDFAHLSCRVWTPGFHARVKKMKVIPFKYILKRKELLLKKLEEEEKRNVKTFSSSPPPPAEATIPVSSAPPLSFWKKFLKLLDLQIVKSS